MNLIIISISKNSSDNFENITTQKRIFDKYNFVWGYPASKNPSRISAEYLAESEGDYLAVFHNKKRAVKIGFISAEGISDSKNLSLYERSNISNQLWDDERFTNLLFFDDLRDIDWPMSDLVNACGYPATLALGNYKVAEEVADRFTSNLMINSVLNGYLSIHMQKNNKKQPREEQQ